MRFNITTNHLSATHIQRQKKGARSFAEILIPSKIEERCYKYL